MRYRFGVFELDLAQRELRRAGQALALQPQVFALLAYLVQERARAVSKRELLEVLWADAVVTEGSLQRLVSLARSALGSDGRTIIRTLTGHGYRCVAQVEELPDEPTALAPAPSAAPPALGSEASFRPRYAKNGEVHVAYTTLGEGDVDVVLVLGWAFPMEAMFTLPEAHHALLHFAERARVIAFDKRGMGMSDRVKELPSLDQRLDDLRAVLDAVRSERAILIGISEGGPLSIAFAEAHPDRVAGLLLVGTFPRMASDHDYPHGWKRSDLGRLKAYVSNQWGAGATLLALIPAAEQARLQTWACTTERSGASPGAALDLLEMNARIDVRDRLARVRAPTIVLHARDDRVTSIESGRYLASHIPGATLREIEGDDHAFLFAGQPLVLEAVNTLLSTERTAHGTSRESHVGAGSK